MLCQSKKRIAWQERISGRLLRVPYAHITFTLPSELHSLSRAHPKVMYQLLLKSAWQTIKELAAKEENIGALPGMISVLHTWGSDLKYHPHVHTLVSFGGLDKSYKWKWPKRRKKIAPFRELCRSYRRIFLSKLRDVYSKGLIDFDKTYDQIEALVKDKRWVVNHQRPTANTWTLENYLAKYICRSAVTTKRLKYDERTKLVSLLYNDYRKQIAGNKAPLGYKTLHPLDAIHHILQHKLPPYFQRSRYYGIHSSATYQKIKDKIAASLKRDPASIKILFSLMRELLQIPSKGQTLCCLNCSSGQLYTTQIKKDELWKYLNIRKYKNKSPPNTSTIRSPTKE